MVRVESEKYQAARRIAQGHLDADESVHQVYLLGSMEDEDEGRPIRLLEVVEGTLEGDTDPVGFAPNPERGVKYPLQIVEVSPEEYQRLSGKLHVGSDWVAIGECLASR